MTFRRWLVRGDEQEEETAEPDETAQPEEEPVDETRVQQMRRYTEARDDGEQDVREPAAEPVQPAPSLASVGEHVTSVLAAAEAAAEKLRHEAEEEAERTRRQAAAEADGLRERAQAEALAEAEEMRERASRDVEQARALRAEAESYAELRRREVDEEAARIVADAEQREAVLAGAARERHQTLLEDIATSEERMANLAANLREVASQLELVAGDRLTLTGSDADAPVGRSAEGWKEEPEREEAVS